MDNVFLLIFIAVVLMLTLLVINTFSSNTWFCRFWGWHKRPEKTGFDGASLNGTCPRCGEKVMQDSQGNWF